ncbi:hypothetical protein BF9343_3550 [Bacteroides fragilis NCTC 9343]|uniref:Uncharacterized protein n=1 Tax=Bacteroides fragilis (strain ATCC 25285 / DSM 2151 / CCUG 4856 / JCM 11019 / LMG 10263 / NCTC 9343 / Onslow / VPI 2553 / EN-2) TaxID=272559 RepID=Q5L998_BACFN|nr:hypothetical protein BF9343_3550 [Bacteroides fragilis NCTC 9343]
MVFFYSIAYISPSLIHENSAGNCHKHYISLPFQSIEEQDLLYPEPSKRFSEPILKYLPFLIP